MSNITSAQSQWFTRPADERFSSLQALHAAALADKARSAPRDVDTLSVKYTGNDLGLVGAHGGFAKLTHWSLSQLARIAGAPAGYLRELPVHIAAPALQHGLDKAGRDTHRLYLSSASADAPHDIQLKAVTSTDYTRVHDADIIERLIRLQEQHPAWHLPLDWTRTPAGAFRGDRDLFVLLVDGGSIVEDPTISTGSGTDPEARALYRGFILRNSEVGASSLFLQTFLFRLVCGNLCIWGAERVTTVRRRHVGRAYTIQAKLAQGFSAARQLAASSAHADQLAIARLASLELGTSRDEVILVGRKVGLTALQAEASFVQAETHEQNPRSVWGYAQGITRASQQLASGWQDERLALDKVAGDLLRKYTVA